MRKILKVTYSKSDGNLFKFIEYARIGVERKYPFATIVDTKIQVNLDAEFVNVLYTIEV